MSKLDALAEPATKHVLNRLVAVAATSALMVLAAGAPAYAGNWGADPTTDYYCTSADWRSECSSDDSWHYVLIESDVNSGVAAAIRSTMTQDYTIYINDPPTVLGAPHH